MAIIQKQDGPRPKCFFSSSKLPSYIDRDKPPTKKKPFSSTLSQPFYHTLDVVLREQDAQLVEHLLHADLPEMKYARVNMKLSEVIEGDFFNQYIKTGNVLMLSEGRPGIDHVFRLCEGTLRLEVDKPTYERMGLQGVVTASDGRKHVKCRYAIDLDLRQPAMVRDKKGFERIVWAFQNVLNSTVTWLFYDLKGPTDSSGPIGPHQPTVRVVEPIVRHLKNISMPGFPESLEAEDFDGASDLLEWISLALLDSPRLSSQDDIDPFLCRYRIPTQINDSLVPPQTTGTDLLRLHWHGFMPSSLVLGLLLQLLKILKEDWFAFSATGFEGKTCTVLQNKHNVLTWDYTD